MAFHEGSNSNHHGNRAPARWSTKLRWVTQRKNLTRRRKLQTVRLGGKKRHNRGMFIVKLVKRFQLRWLKLKYSLLLKKLKNFYYSLVKELLEGGSTLEAAQQRLIMESYFTVPILGLSLSA